MRFRLAISICLVFTHFFFKLEKRMQFKSQKPGLLCGNIISVNDILRALEHFKARVPFFYTHCTIYTQY